MSKCVKPLTENELTDLLYVARIHNAIHDITGVLVYSDGSIFQVIEGDKKNLDQLYLNISRDSRHTCLGKLADKEISKRCFADWTMAYYGQYMPSYESLSGVCKIEDLDFSPENLGTVDSMMLQTLKDFFIK